MRHTVKCQIVIEQKSKKILSTSYGKGKQHEFKLFKRSKICLPEQVICLEDKGYQRIKNIHQLSKIPQKKTKRKNCL